MVDPNIMKASYISALKARMDEIAAFKAAPSKETFEAISQPLQVTQALQYLKAQAPAQAPTPSTDGTEAGTYEYTYQDPQAPAWWSYLFPFLGLGEWTRYGQELMQGGTWTGTYTGTEPPAGGTIITGDTSGGIGGAFEGLTTGLTIAGAAIPIMIVIMLLTQVKGLFK